MDFYVIFMQVETKVHLSTAIYKLMLLKVTWWPDVFFALLVT